MAVSENAYKNAKQTRMMIRYSSLIEETLTETYKYSSEEVFGFFGGLLGLCTGTSVLSLVEIIIAVFLSIVIKFYAMNNK